jgi:hypothetical protein
MRWALIAQNDASGAFLLAGGFAFHQHLDPACEHINLVLLSGDNIAQLFDAAGQVGDTFFEVLHKDSGLVATS